MLTLFHYNTAYLKCQLTVLAVRDIPSAPPSNDHPLKIIIYTDFECIACARFASEIEPVLREKYVDTGKAQIEIRLLGAISDDSAREAEAAPCARGQGKFYEYKDALLHAYAQEEDTAVFSLEALTGLAARLGLHVEAFAHCLTSGANEAEVEENM
jgi:protein-disulfide isomerase